MVLQNDLGSATDGTVNGAREADQSGNTISQLATLPRFKNQDELERSLDVLRLAYRQARNVRDLAIGDMAEIKALAKEVASGRMAATFAIARAVEIGLIELADDRGVS